jgi:predicted TIM-barrel fold metal-dependent hydrolase
MAIDIECDIPTKEVAQSELLQFGNTVLPDRILFARSWKTLSIPMKEIIQETEALTRRESVKRKWRYENAARILKLK